MTQARRFVALLVGMALVVATCGGDGLSVEEQTMADEIALAHAAGDYELELAQPSAGECMGEELLRIAGADRLRVAGFGVGGFGDQDAVQDAVTALIRDLGLDHDDTADLYRKCFNSVEFLAGEFIDDGVPVESAVCAAEGLLGLLPERSFGVDVPDVVLAVTLEDGVYSIFDGEFGSEAYQAASECLAPEVLADLLGSGG